jgi:acyl-CoA thioesterase-2
MFELEPHGPDTFVGTGPQYPWGGLYGGQIVAQALRAATLTTEEQFVPHSIRAYFIRPGDHTEPIRYEVDRIRNGRSFLTRRVVARQAIGAILNAECSLQRDEAAPSVQTVTAPEVPGPDTVENTSFGEHFDRRFVPVAALPAPAVGAGRVAAWMRVLHPLADDPVLHQAWLAFISDDLPSDAVRQARALATGAEPDEPLMTISLDHAIWFHRPMRADRWHLHDVSCHHLHGGRGLAVGHVFDEAGAHVATVAQEVLLRRRRG